MMSQANAKRPLLPHDEPADRGVTPPVADLTHKPITTSRGRRRRARVRSHLRSVVSLGGCSALVALLIAGCGASKTVSARHESSSSPSAAPSWMSYQRPASASIVTSQIQVPTRDGTDLGCTMFRPAVGGAPAPGKFPVIVSNFWPYYTRSQYGNPAQNPNAKFFAQHGYIDLVCSMRGTYNSSGTFPGWFMPSDVTDDYDIVEWAASQPWSSGRIGQEGASYGGINTLKAAAARPPHLVAIAPQFAFQDAYLGYFYPGGIPNDISQSPAQGVQDYRGTTPERQNATWSAHPLDDAFWQKASVPTDKINVPTLMIGGWLDYMLVGDIANYLSLPRSDGWLVMGPWEHATEPPATLEPMLLAWFDHWLKGLPDAPLPSARVTSFEMSAHGGNGWTEMPSYPPADASSVRYDFNTDQTLAGTAGPAGTKSYVVNPHDGPPAICFPPGGGPCDPTSDMAKADAKRLTFTSSPLNAAMVLVGSMEVHLRAALSATDGDLVVKVEDVAPDGTVHQASVGYLKASHRLSQSTPAAVVPNQPTDFVISVWPMDWRLPKGDRLRLSVTSGDYPKIAADAPSGTVTVATGQDGSFVDLIAQNLG